MTDENNVEAAPEAAPKAKKPAKVKRKKQEASRIAYKDRHKIKMSGLDTDNYEYRIVNTDDGKYAGRVEQLKERGYDIAKEGEFADDSGIEAGALGSIKSKPVGHGTRGVLMRIPKKYYQEDLVAKRAEVDETEEGMVSEELRSGSDMVGAGVQIQRPQFEVQ